MNNRTDQELLRDYVECRSDTAFAELVQRHVDLVYSAALRMVCDAHLAKDVTQSVFVALAQKSRQLVDRPVLSGWLHRTAQNLSANAVRSEVRRRTREQEAVAMKELLANESDATWEQIAPQLDAAIGELGDADRDAVLLRYFERKSGREMAEILGTSEEAAQKRVTRAVERLREFFAKRGVTVGASGLVVLIATNAVQAAPVGLAVTISAALGTGIVAATATQTALTTMNWINIKSAAAIAAAAIVAGAGTHFVQQREANQLRADNQNLVAQQAKLTSERDAALSATAQQAGELEQQQKDKSELLRLRNEVGQLRKQTSDLEKLRQENLRLQAALTSATQSSAPSQKEAEANPEQQIVVAKLNDAKLLTLGWYMYADAHQGRLPTDLNQTSNYWKTTERPLTGTNEFELLIQGSMDGIPNPATTIVVREKNPSLRNGKWGKAYGFADGHAEFKSEPPEGFEAWEKQRMIPATTFPPSDQGVRF